ncbi:Protein ALP1-like [Frankliniella fusca]|uniref:Protein ALP1-like n=1 Tax=Frankliniella fusca TaxID=407009 RepID=A0AAE1LJA5_9NEOP|nr:Protein ALP1-like [Frankliniella fusca]
MARPSITKVIKYYCLLEAELERQGYPFTEPERGSIKRIIAYNLLKRFRAHAREHARLARRRKPRRWHVRPIFQSRETFGAWFSLVPVMRELDPDEFYRFFRMTVNCFDCLLEKVEPFITKRSNRKSVSAGERLAITLRYLASGDSQSSLSYLFRLSNQAISKIVTETTSVIWYALKPIVFEEINEDFWRRKAAEFEAMWQFPMCVGAIDGKHCSFQKFPMRGSEFYNYKGTNSIILFAVADAQYKFIVADAGAKGREGDSGVFDRSTFGELFYNHRLHLPSLVHNEKLDCLLPYVFLGDGAFPLDEHLMTPFEPNERDELTGNQALFNYRLSRARRVVENAFGILSARVRILRRTAIVSETLACNIILSTCALHNLHLMREESIPPKQRLYLPPGFSDTYKSNGHMKPGRWRNKVPHLEKTIFMKLVRQEIPGAARNKNPHYPSLVREDFVELFLAQPVPWQWGEPM